VTKHDLDRRTFIKRSTTVAAGTLPSLALPVSTDATRLKVVCVGGHPDDPESGCGGTLARFAALGHDVTIVYLTRGERGIAGKTLDDAARIRSAECETACRIIGAKPAFFGQIDGASEVTQAQIESMRRLIATEKPDVLFAHWPVDTHMDHQVASILTVRAWMSLNSPSLYFFEVDLGSQTEGFFPNTYVDISTVVEQKKASLFAHASQDGRGIWREHHEIMAQWRGREIGVAAAEAFIHLNRDHQGSPLPGL